jgi:DNA (cytosine-5)-methyltransferase 1
MVEAFLTKYHGPRPGEANGRAADPADPIRTLDTQNRIGVVATTIQRFKHGEAEHVQPQQPMQTICAGGNNHAVVSATLLTNTTGHACTDLHQPAPTLTSGEQQALLTGTLVQTGYGEREGQDPRVPGLDKPLGTVVGGGSKHALVGATLIGAGGPAYGGKPASPGEPAGTLMTENHRALVSASLVGVGGRAGQSPERGADDPVHTITAKGDTAIAAAHLTKFYGTGTGQPADAPMPTITGGGSGGNSHIGEVRAFLVKYYGTGGQDQSCTKPLHTLTAKARMGLVTLGGQDYQIADIGLRMLQPRELLRAQFGRFADEYILTGTKADQVAAIGNSVCPELAEAIVRANFPEGR